MTHAEYSAAKKKFLFFVHNEHNLCSNILLGIKPKFCSTGANFSKPCIHVHSKIKFFSVPYFSNWFIWQFLKVYRRLSLETNWTGVCHKSSLLFPKNSEFMHLRKKKRKKACRKFLRDVCDSLYLLYWYLKLDVISHAW